MVVLVPAYQPDARLVDLVRQLSHHRVVVVDDGSGDAYAPVFERARSLGAEVLTLAGNRGKGYALRTGFAHIRLFFPDEDVVCADSDGQHRPEDIEAVAKRLAVTGAAMVLGARRFVGRVPARSRYGNALTRAVYTLATGRALVDTQTGLRGYPARMLPWLGEVGGDRFDYEMRLLLRAARENLGVEEVEIATVYLERNASSHFRPVRDSVRIYGPLFAFSASSMLAFAIDTVALLVLASLTDNLVASAIGARLVSATVNYGVNRAWVFGSHRGPGRRGASASRYAALALGMFAANVVLLRSLTTATGSIVVAKAVTELGLFAVNFVLQKNVVFARPAYDAGHAVPPRQPVS